MLEAAFSTVVINPTEKHHVPSNDVKCILKMIGEHYYNEKNDENFLLSAL